MGSNLTIWLVFILGIIVGGVLFSKDFRQKFFTGFRKFLSGVGKTNLNPNNRKTNQNQNQNQNPSNSGQNTQGNIVINVNPANTSVGKDCPTCKGSGKVVETPNPLMKNAPGYFPKPIICPTCKGSGKVWG